MKDNNIQHITVKQLLEKDQYRIPIYQRNYAWGMSETRQLIQDIADYGKIDPKSNYYIGNLIVFPRNTNGEQYFETIDGQQRITTLTILMCAIKDNYEKHEEMNWYRKVNVMFDHRENSNITLQYIYSGEWIDAEDVNMDILSVSKNAWKAIVSICSDIQLTIDDFIKYLINKVIILRVNVPRNTDLNHYFEIMNSRGEQLEQHEVVKAQLMSTLNESPGDFVAFNLIWEACSNMDRYLQMNFDLITRNLLFRDQGIDNVTYDFDSFSKEISKLKEGVVKTDYKSLDALYYDAQQKLPYTCPWKEENQKEYPENFNSIISFSNFLLHVLKILYPQDSSIVLDDKTLIPSFKKIMEIEKDKALFSKYFVMKLLRIRFLFDKYIIKRSQDKWSLKKIVSLESEMNKYYYKGTFGNEKDQGDYTKENKKIIMLQSMFHVSAPTQIRKHWMNAALNYVYRNSETSAERYAAYLWKLAQAYMLDKYLANKENSITFEDIIYKNEGKPINKIENIDWSNINIVEVNQPGERIENFVFNFYDYLLWIEEGKDDFEFTYRTSVEHFYPQHPIGKVTLEYSELHSFGNLCLISRGMNSKFSNNLPEAKNANFGDADSLKTYSLKLQKMMQIVKERNSWYESTIEEEEQKAKEKIESALL